MKKDIIGIVLNSLLKEYNNGACDDLDEETQEELFDSFTRLKDKMEDKLDKVLTIEEASIYLNCTRLTLNNYVREGKLKPKKHLGGVLEFKLRDLKWFVKQSKH